MDGTVASELGALPDGLHADVVLSDRLAQVIGFESLFTARPAFYLPITRRSTEVDQEHRRLMILVHDASGGIAATARVERLTDVEGRRFIATVAVREDLRRQGIAATLADRLDLHLREQEAESVAADVRADLPEAQGFARSREMKEMHRRRHWYLDLQAADPAHFEDAAAIARHARIEIADYGSEVERVGRDVVDHRLHELHMDLIAEANIPQPVPYAEFDLYRRLFLNGVIGPATLIARQGERYVGMTLVLDVGDEKTHAAGLMTGAVGQPRVRRAGLALRLRSIAALKELGYRELMIGFDLDNHPMRRIIQRLGAEPGPEIVRFEKALV